MEQMFELANIVYVAPGDASATGLPDGSIDLFFAYSVFQYVPLYGLHAFCSEVRAVLRPGTGRFWAQVACGDDYAGFDKKPPYARLPEIQRRTMGADGEPTQPLLF